MSSPQETTSDGTRKNFEQITFRFCSECSNMLYPKEDPDSHKLQFTCRTCQYTEEATSTCVFRNVMNNAVGETAGVTQDVGSDPTVSSPSPAVSVSVVFASRGNPVAGNFSGEYTGEYPTMNGRSNTTASRDTTPPAKEDIGIDEGVNINFIAQNVPHPHLMDCDLVGVMCGVIATSIYNCLEPGHQASCDRELVESLVSDISFSLQTASAPAYFGDTYYQDGDADPPEALGEEPCDTGVDLQF